MSSLCHKLISVLVVLVVGAFPAALISGRASALSASDFNAGYIISDQQFYNSNAMTASDVQSFLNARGSSCVAGQMPCLKNYGAGIAGTPAEAGLCGAISAASYLSAAQMIDTVARACGISQQVILTTIQKESALVSKSQPNSVDYRSAVGYGCPDTSACDAQYYGFFNQIYRMSRQFKIYGLYPTAFGYQSGRYNTIQYNPNSGCGSSSVFIQNQATANLYIYTPYQPNAAALNNMYGTGDACSAYGNRNFWRIFNDWFGQANTLPGGSLDAATINLTSVQLSGWAADPDTWNASNNVAVYRDDVLVAWVAADQARPDVNNALGIPGNHGYVVNLIGQPPGPHNYCVYASDTSGAGNFILKCATLSGSNAPFGGYDSVSAAGNNVTFSGWAMDIDHPGQSVNIAAYRGSTLVAWTLASEPRPDVVAALGISGSFGYSVTLQGQPGGAQTYCLYAADIDGTGNYLIGCKSTVVPTGSPIPIGHVEAAQLVGGVIHIHGWAFDPNQPDSTIYVATYSDRRGLVGWTPTTTVRPDVTAAFLASGSHGFDISIAGQAAGPETYCVYGSAISGSGNYLIGCSTVVV